MPTYDVYHHPARGYDAVKRGFSWPGFFFCFYWAAFKELWVIACALVLVTLIPEVVDVLTGITDPTDFWSLSMPAYAVFAILAGFRGNAWRRENLIGRGFELAAEESAASPERARRRVAERHEAPQAAPEA